jgi:hypothetical protein
MTKTISVGLGLVLILLCSGMVFSSIIFGHSADKVVVNINGERTLQNAINRNLMTAPAYAGCGSGQCISGYSGNSPSCETILSFTKKGAPLSGRDFTIRPNIPSYTLPPEDGGPFTNPVIPFTVSPSVYPAAFYDESIIGTDSPDLGGSGSTGGGSVVVPPVTIADPIVGTPLTSPAQQFNLMTYWPSPTASQNLIKHFSRPNSDITSVYHAYTLAGNVPNQNRYNVEEYYIDDDSMRDIILTTVYEKNSTHTFITKYNKGLFDATFSSNSPLLVANTSVKKGDILQSNATFDTYQVHLKLDIVEVYQTFTLSNKDNTIYSNVIHVRETQKICFDSDCTIFDTTIMNYYLAPNLGKIRIDEFDSTTNSIVRTYVLSQSCNTNQEFVCP